MERGSRNPNNDGKLIGREQAKHGGDGLLHRVLGAIRNALGDDGGVKGFDSLEHVSNHREAAVEARPPRRDELIGDTPAVDAGDEAADGGG